jgi:hypothetical protein
LATTAERRHVAAQIGVIARHDPADPRLVPLRRRLRFLVAADLAAWAEAVLSDLDDDVEYKRLVAEAQRVRRAKVLAARRAAARDEAAA